MRIRTSILGILVAVAACGPSAYVSSAPVDPCDASYYNDVACQTAVVANGFYYMGAFVPHVYVQPYGYYHSYYGTYRSRGGVVHVVSPSYYSRTYVGSSRTVVRGPSVYQSTVPTTTVISPRGPSVVTRAAPTTSSVPRTVVRSSPTVRSTPRSSSSSSRRR